MLHLKIKELEEANNKLKFENDSLKLENADLKKLNEFIGNWLALKIVWKQNYIRIKIIEHWEQIRRKLDSHIKGVTDFIDVTDQKLNEVLKNKKSLDT